MLRLMHILKGYQLSAKGEAFGSVKDFLFDEDHWTIRYMVADTGRWLSGRKVLVSPVALRPPDWASGSLYVELEKEQLEKAPALETDAPVSRQYEMSWHDALGYPYYWGLATPWAYGLSPWDRAKGEPAAKAPAEASPEDRERVLRSVEEVRKYHIKANDGEVGHVDDFIMDDETWAIRYLVIDTRNWLPGRKVLLAPGWTGDIDWKQRHITTTLSRDAIKSGPEFDPTVPVNRDYEQKLHDYYGRPAYWA